MNGQIPFRVAIVAIVVGLLAVTCGALIAYGLHTNQRNYEILKRDYLDQVSQAAAREVARLPRTASQILRAERQRFESGQHAARDGVALAGAFVGALEADPDVQWVSYGAANGRFSGVHRVDGGAIVLNVSDPAHNRGIPREFYAGTLKPHARPASLDQPYDPRTRPWYRRAASSAGDIAWMPPYKFTEGVTGITAALAVRDSTRRVQGVLTVDFTVAGIARFLETLEIAHGTVVLFDQDGTFLAGAPGAGREAAIRATDDWEGVPPPAGTVRRA